MTSLQYVYMIMLRFRGWAPSLATVYTFGFEVADMLADIGSEPVNKMGAGSDMGILLRQIVTFAQARDQARSGAPDLTTARTPSPGPGTRTVDADGVTGNGAEEEQPLRSFSEVIAANGVPNLVVPSTSSGSGSMHLPTSAPPGLDPSLWQPQIDAVTTSSSSKQTGECFVLFTLPSTPPSDLAGKSADPVAPHDFGAFDLGMFEEMTGFVSSFGTFNADPISTPSINTSAAVTGFDVEGGGRNVPVDPTLNVPPPAGGNGALDWSQLF